MKFGPSGPHFRTREFRYPVPQCVDTILKLCVITNASASCARAGRNPIFRAGNGLAKKPGRAALDRRSLRSGFSPAPRELLHVRIRRVVNQLGRGVANARSRLEIGGHGLKF